jgi:dynein heavy chain, axonemal
MWSFGGMASSDNGTFETNESNSDSAAVEGVNSEVSQRGGSQFDSRRAFSEAWRSSFKQSNAPYPNEGLVFDYCVHPSYPSWKSWSSILERKVIGGGATGSSASGAGVSGGAYLIMPTIDTCRCTDLLSLFHEAKRATLVMGSGGCGKTSLITSYLKEEEERIGKHNIIINMNYYTESKDMQLQLEAPLEKRGGRVYGPLGGKKLFYFIDDFNMSAQEKYVTHTYF